jgi:hypothetical protein
MHPKIEGFFSQPYCSQKIIVIDYQSPNQATRFIRIIFDNKIVQILFYFIYTRFRTLGQIKICNFYNFYHTKIVNQFFIREKNCPV